MSHAYHLGFRTEKDSLRLPLRTLEARMRSNLEPSRFSGIGLRIFWSPSSLVWIRSRREGDCLAAKLHPGNVPSAEGWGELLLPEIERQQQRGKEMVFRADAAVAKPKLYAALEERDVKYAMFPVSTSWTDCSD
jgi:hypothetical protein